MTEQERLAAIRNAREHLRLSSGFNPEGGHYKSVLADLAYMSQSKLPDAKRRSAAISARQHLTRAHGFNPTGVHYRIVLTELVALEQSFAPSLQDRLWEKLYAAMQNISHDTPGYLLGGGHGVPLSSLSTHQRLDCSSSCSLALYEAGMFDPEYAIVSGEFARSWGHPGTGAVFTVYANYEHVWIRLYRSQYWRFDTSPHGDGGRGPKLRHLPRRSGSFAARHWAGM